MLQTLVRSYHAKQMSGIAWEVQQRHASAATAAIACCRCILAQCMHLHCLQTTRESYFFVCLQVYTCPTYFTDDWLNAFFLRLQPAAARCGPAPAANLPQSAAHPDWSPKQVPVQPPVTHDSARERPPSAASPPTPKEPQAPDLTRTPGSPQARDGPQPPGLPDRGGPCACSASAAPPASSGQVEQAWPAALAANTSEAASTADYRFAYVGLAGSRTLLHADVLRSHSWSVNVVGTKRCGLYASVYLHSSSLWVHSGAARTPLCSCEPD